MTRPCLPAPVAGFLVSVLVALAATTGPNGDTAEASHAVTVASK